MVFSAAQTTRGQAVVGTSSGTRALKDCGGRHCSGLMHKRWLGLLAARRVVHGELDVDGARSYASYRARMRAWPWCKRRSPKPRARAGSHLPPLAAVAQHALGLAVVLHHHGSHRRRHEGAVSVQTSRQMRCARRSIRSHPPNEAVPVTHL